MTSGDYLFPTQKISPFDYQFLSMASDLKAVLDTNIYDTLWRRHQLTLRQRILLRFESTIVKLEMYFDLPVTGTISGMVANFPTRYYTVDAHLYWSPINALGLAIECGHHDVVVENQNLITYEHFRNFAICVRRKHTETVTFLLTLVFDNDNHLFSLRPRNTIEAFYLGLPSRVHIPTFGNHPRTYMFYDVVTSRELMESSILSHAFESGEREQIIKAIGSFSASRYPGSNVPQDRRVQVIKDMEREILRLAFMSHDVDVINVVALIFPYRYTIEEYRDVIEHMPVEFITEYTTHYIRATKQHTLEPLTLQSCPYDTRMITFPIDINILESTLRTYNMAGAIRISKYMDINLDLVPPPFLRMKTCAR